VCDRGTESRSYSSITYSYYVKTTDMIFRLLVQLQRNPMQQAAISAHVELNPPYSDGEECPSDLNSNNISWNQ